MSFRCLAVTTIESGAAFFLAWICLQPKSGKWYRRIFLITNILFGVINSYVLALNAGQVQVTNHQLTWSEMVRVPLLLGYVIVLGLVVQGGLFRSLLMIIIGDMLMMITELTGQMVYIAATGFSRDSLLYYSDYTPALLVLTLIMNIVIMVLPARFYKWFFSYRWERYWPIKILGIAYLIAGYSKMITHSMLIGDDMPLLILDIITVFAMLLVCVWGIFRVRFAKDREELLHLAMINQIQEEYQEIMKVQLWRLRLFRHDIKNHIGMIQYAEQQSATDEVEVQQLQEYKDQLYGMYKQLSGGDYCSNRDFNVCIFQLEKFCKERGITFEAKLRNIDVNSWNEADLYKICMTMINDVISRVVKAEVTSGKIILEGQRAAGYNMMCLKLQDFPVFSENTEQGKIVPELSRLLKKYDGEIVLKREQNHLVYRLDWA